jgi:hypothetical protein
VEETVMIKHPSILSLILLLLGGSAAWAQDSNEVAKLKARVEKLEAENAAIKRELAKLKKTLAAEAKLKKADADITKLLVGKWRFEPGKKDPPIKMTMTYAKDQTFSLEAESVQVEFKATGTWKVEKGEIVTVKKSTNRKKTKRVARTKVISVDDSTLKVPASVIAPTGVPVPIEELRELVIVFKKVK